MPFWPTSTDNLSWSADNHIAVGGGDWIGILVPRLNAKGPNNLPWDSISFKVNLFSTNEIPFCEPLSSTNWSIGEEMSLRHVVGIEWSPPGLARFGTCALAILHSCHVLVLWECVGQPHIRDKWRRCLIVNHVIQAYYGTSITDDPERRQVRQRIRSFAWAPAAQAKHKSIDRLLDPHLAHREHFVAVSTDAGDIFILKMQSPHDALGPDNLKWGAKVVHRLQLSSGVSLDIGATALAFSDWHKGSNAKFAYLSSGHLFVCDAQYDSSADAESRVVLSEPQELILSLSGDLTGPLRFAPKSNILFLSGPDTIFGVDTSGDPNEQPLSHHLDGRWDDLSGLAFTADVIGNSTVHIASHLSTTSSATSNFSMALESDTREPGWQNAIHESKANFSASFDLGPNVQERTWGIASSPLGDSIATCVTLLPSDSPAHIIQSELRSVIAITAHVESKDIPFPFEGGRSPPQDISAETIMYGIRQFLVRGGKIDGTEQLRDATRQFVANALELSLPTKAPPLPWADEDEESFEATPENLSTCFVHMRACLYYEDNMFFQRVDRLIDVVMQRQPKLQLAKDEYKHITASVLALPAELREAGPISRRISNALKAVKSRLDTGTSAVDPAMVDSAPFVETCSICQHEVVFESLRWSRCGGGHQFPRCSLTFFSIMEPGISKTCRICNALYLNEEAMPELKGNVAEGAKTEQSSITNGMDIDGDPSAVNQNHDAQTAGLVEPNASLARLLFAASNLCILCGGKFTA